MSVDQRTIQTYDSSAKQMATHFQNYKDGVAREEITVAFRLAGRSHVGRVVEIGCGAGKDAAEIIQHTDRYEGLDPSEQLLEIARVHVPGATFVKSDALAYDYGSDIDVVFAFASLLHLNREDFASACRKVTTALKPGGVFCMTLKEADAYTEQLQEDEFGTRLFYLYTPALVRELAGDVLELAMNRTRQQGQKIKGG